MKQILRNELEGINDKLWEYYRKCYSEDSNDIFDDEHDGIYYHIMGFNETFEEFMEDYNVPEWTPKMITIWKETLSEELECANQIEAYYLAVVKATKPNYIYG